MSNQADNVARMGVLYGEHALLGASFSSSDDGSDIRVVSYPSEKGGSVDSGPGVTVMVFDPRREISLLIESCTP